MERSLFASALALGLLVSGMPLACGQAFSLAPAGDDGGAEAQAGNDGSPLDQTADGPSDGSPSDGVGSDAHDAPHDGTPEAVSPGHIVYVSTAGSDSNDGTDPTKPKLTIAMALQRVASIPAPAEVHVCAGVYPESGLTLAQSLPLLGGYNCTSWTRAAGYGFPSFDETNKTTITNKLPSAQAATLVVADGVTSSALIDGFVIEGATTWTSTTVGLQTMGSASPVVQNDIFSGGGGSGGTTNAGSVGVEIASGSPEVRFSAIFGGSGTGSTGSVAISVGGTGAPNVHDDIVSGGTGTTTTTASTGGGVAAAGMYVGAQLAGPTALKNVFVVGSDSAVAGPSIGVFIGSTAVAVDIQDSVIEGGTGSGPSTFSAAIEIDDPGGAIRVLSDRVYGGSRTGSASETLALYDVSSSKLVVDDSEIHAGEATGGVGSTSFGVQLLAALTPTFIDDTIYTGPGYGFGLSIASGVNAVTITDDLFAGGDGTKALGAAISVANCSGQLATVDHNAFVNFDVLYGCSSLTTVATTTASLAFDLTGVATSGNVEIASNGACDGGSCANDPSCPGPPAQCLGSIFGASWTTDDGVTGLQTGAPTGTDAAAIFQGWTLVPNTTLCALARGGTPAGGITTDLFMQPRSATAPTIGAFEYSNPNCAN